MSITVIDGVVSKIIKACQELKGKRPNDSELLGLIERKAQSYHAEHDAQKRTELARKLLTFLKGEMRLHGITGASVPWAGKSIFDTEVQINGAKTNLIFLVADLCDVLTLSPK